MSTTLHLTGQVILTDSTGTRLPATDLATALDTVTTSRSGHTPTIAVTDTYNALPVDPATFTVHEDGQLTPAPDTTARPAYTFSYTAFTLTDPTGVASPVQPSALATIGQSAADRLGHEVTITSDLPGITDQHFTPTAPTPPAAPVSTAETLSLIHI